MGVGIRVFGFQGGDEHLQGFEQTLVETLVQELVLDAERGPATKRQK
jgi:hypothetical protein